MAATKATNRSSSRDDGFYCCLASPVYYFTSFFIHSKDAPFSIVVRIYLIEGLPLPKEQAYIEVVKMLASPGSLNQNTTGVSLFLRIDIFLTIASILLVQITHRMYQSAHLQVSS